MSDWPDLRIPERNISHFEIVIVGVFAITPSVIWLYGLIAPLIQLAIVG